MEFKRGSENLAKATKWDFENLRRCRKWRFEFRKGCFERSEGFFLLLLLRAALSRSFVGKRTKSLTAFESQLKWRNPRASWPSRSLPSSAHLLANFFASRFPPFLNAAFLRRDPRALNDCAFFLLWLMAVNAPLQPAISLRTCRPERGASPRIVHFFSCRNGRGRRFFL